MRFAKDVKTTIISNKNSTGCLNIGNEFGPCNIVDFNYAVPKPMSKPKSCPAYDPVIPISANP